MRIWIWSILDRYVGISSKHQRHTSQDDYTIRFPKFDIVRLHLYQGISAKITPKCDLMKENSQGWYVYKSKCQIGQAWNAQDTIDK